MPLKPSDTPPVPNDLDAEESVLGAMLLTPRAIEAVDEVALQAADFYRRSHGLLFDACVGLHAAGTPVDSITVAAFLEAAGTLSDVGGKERVHELAALVPAAGNVAHYARIVREKSLLRSLVSAGAKVTGLGYAPGGEADAAVEEAQREVMELGRRRGTRDAYTADEVALETMTKLQHLYDGGDPIVGLPTGFRDIDHMTSGLRPGQLAVVAGRPSMGKTAFALGVLAHTALRTRLPCVIFTYEMTRGELMERMLSAESFVQSDHIQTPSRMRPDDWRRVSETATRVAASPLLIDDDRTTTMLELRAKARRIKRAHPTLALIVVDYLQLMQSGASRYESKNLDVANMSRDMKLMAGELDVPVVVLSQLNRSVESRHDRRPYLSDLRDSGSIEQDADLVLLLYRGSYYMPDDEELQGVAEVDVAKQRNGPVGMRRLAFVDQYARFSDLDRGTTGDRH